MGRRALVRVLVSVRGITLEEASGWCDAWEKNAARSGLRSEAPYFWDAARGWIDAQLDGRLTEVSRPTARPAVAARSRR
jgi:hypothetical protein